MQHQTNNDQTNLKLRQMNTHIETGVQLCLIGLILCFLFWLNMNNLSAAPDSPQTTEDFTTVITVNTINDPTPASATTTCVYTASGLTPGDVCSLRRAIIDASKRPATDRPILIAFDLPADDANTDVPGTWTIQIDATNALPAVTTISRFDDPNSQVTIDGATQPNGRTDGPAVFVNSRSSLVLERGGNTVKEIGFFGGGTLQLQEVSGIGGSNHVEAIWMGLSLDGQSIVFQDEDRPEQLAGGSIVISSDNNVISNTVIAGTRSPAIKVDAADENTIANNRVGMRADGTVPAYNGSGDHCAPALIHNPATWYGGWGIHVSGSSRKNTVLGNRIAGLQDIRSIQDTPPQALFVGGQEHLVQNNMIGIDAQGTKVGVCGIGIDVGSAGQEVRVWANVVVYSRYGYGVQRIAGDTALLVSSSVGGVSVRGNLIEIDETRENSPTKAVRFAPIVPIILQRFEPAQIISMTIDADQTTVLGTNGNQASQCGNCTIDFY